MTFPVQIEPNNGYFTATLVGAPEVSATAGSRAEALAALETCIEQRIAKGDLVSLEVGPRGVSDLAGIFADDPTLREICEEAYRLRDSESGE
jgi:predicted RNase H-like HicB family nuclease